MRHVKAEGGGGVHGEENHEEGGMDGRGCEKGDREGGRREKRREVLG